MKQITEQDYTDYQEHFRQYIYPEIKDLGKQFLTFASGVLTFTIFFANNFIDIENKSYSNLFYFISLFLLVASLILIGMRLWLCRRVYQETVVFR